MTDPEDPEPVASVDALAAALRDLARGALDDGSITIGDLRRLTGGASCETWAFDAVPADGDPVALILRRDPPAFIREDGMALEAAAIAGARQEGVPVPEIVDAGDGGDGIGSPYILMHEVPGETLPRRILSDDSYASARERLAEECGTTLARIHRIPTDRLWTAPVTDPLPGLRSQLDDFSELGIDQPALELGIRWLEAERPEHRRNTLVHGDFRLGNLMIGPDGIRAVLDWEGVHIGDPMQDLGWLCVRTWRFKSPKPVGGFGEYEELFAAYEAESGLAVDPGVVRWWELYGTVWWGIGCIRMAQRHREGQVRSVEYAAIGRRACENEYDALLLIEQMLETATR